MTSIIGVIPARIASTRFPGKPRVPIRGAPMLEHVHRRARACRAVSQVFVAKCDDEIAQAVHAFGGEVMMTSAAHERASDRVAEVASRIRADIVVMVQGDEPLIRPEMIEAAVAAMIRDSSIGCVNLLGPIRSDGELQDRNTIKVVTTTDGRALFSSREPIPIAGNRVISAGAWCEHVCLIAFRRVALLCFANLPRGQLQELETIDMLRFLENGLPVQVVLTGVETHAVDVPEDLNVVSSLLDRSPWPTPCSAEPIS